MLLCGTSKWVIPQMYNITNIGPISLQGPWAAHHGSRCAIQGTLQQHQRHSVGKQWLAEQPRPLALKGDLPQLRIDLSNPCNVSLGPSSVLRMRRYRPGSAFLGSRSGAPAAMQLAAVSTSNGGVLAKCSSTGFSQASRARPTRPKTCCHARLDKFCVVNFIHYSPPPLTG